MNDLDYIGVAPCGCLKFWVSHKSNQKDLATGVANIITRGLELKRCTTEEARDWPMKCQLCGVVDDLFPR